VHPNTRLTLNEVRATAKAQLWILSEGRTVLTEGSHDTSSASLRLSQRFRSAQPQCLAPAPV
jgi:hypothetical protein